MAVIYVPRVGGGTLILTISPPPTSAKLYCDWWFNVSANANTTDTATLRFNVSNSATQGNNTAQVVTPGYSAKTVASILKTFDGRHRVTGRIVTL